MLTPAAHWNLIGRNIKPTAVFFRHLRFAEHSFPQQKIRRALQK
jgi:hypothetical protein